MKTKPKRGEQSRIDEHFKTLQTLYLLLLTVTCVIGSLILRPDHTRQIDDALKVLNTLRMAESMFREEHLPRVQAEGQRLFRELVFLKLAESIERTFGLSLDVAAAELNFTSKALRIQQRKRRDSEPRVNRPLRRQRGDFFRI
jgi:hypothetical protein